MTRQIVIDIGPDGTVKIDAQGFQGGACAKATEQLELVLGGGARKTKKDYKPEFYNPAGTHHKLTF